MTNQLKDWHADGDRLALTPPRPPLDFVPLLQALDRSEGETATVHPLYPEWAPVDTAPILKGLFDGTLPAPTHDLVRLDGGGHLLSSGAVNLLTGAPGSGKSWTAVACCADVMSEHNVLYLDWEDRAENVISRLMGIEVPRLTIGERFDYIHPDTRYDRNAAHNVISLIEDRDIRLVVIDSTGEALAGDGLDGNADQDVSYWFEVLPRAIARTRPAPAVLLLDHLAKASGDGARFPIGSQRKLAAIDGIALRQEMKTGHGFTKTRTGSARLYVTKDRRGVYAEGSHVADLTLTPLGREVAPGIGAMNVTLKAVTATDAPKSFRPTWYMEAVSKVIENAPAPLGVRAIRETVGKNKDRVTDAIRVLIAEGYVRATAGPRNAVLHESVKPYREELDPLAESFLGVAPATVALPIKGGPHSHSQGDDSGRSRPQSATVDGESQESGSMARESDNPEERPQNGHGRPRSDPGKTTVAEKYRPRSISPENAPCPHGAPPGATCIECQEPQRKEEA